VCAPHESRSFAELPDATRATRLLDDLATAPCAFAPVAADRSLALYGAGSLGRLAREFLTGVGRDFAVIIDRNAEALAREPYWIGTRLLRPDAVTAVEKHGLRFAVSIVTSPYVPIEQSLREYGFDEVVPFYDLAESFRAVHPLSNGWFAPPFSTRDCDNTTEVLALWHDDCSRAHHLQFLAWRRLRQEWRFDAAPVSIDDRFFIPEVAGLLGTDEFMLDAGAHHGEVIEGFLARTSGGFRRIIAIEPDPENRAVLQERLGASLADDPRVSVHDAALAADARSALFHAGLGYASQLAPTGRLQATTQPLDALDLAPSFLKLHLEGGELAALKGARDTLRRGRPIIAATVYHNADGIWKTPLWLMRTLPDYRFLFRLHGWCGTGAVVYAIPQERIARA